MVSWYHELRTFDWQLTFRYGNLGGTDVFFLGGGDDEDLGIQGPYECIGGETYTVPENQWLKDEMSFWDGLFWGPMLVLGIFIAWK